MVTKRLKTVAKRLKTVTKRLKTVANRLKTRKRRSITSSKQYSQQNIVTTFLQMLNTVKLYHWKTFSYAQHKATDELYTNLNANIDAFVEIMLGKTGGRVNLTGQKTLPLLDYNNVGISLKKSINTRTF
jgi:dTDP-D-glucose 4,6-dehydratase